MALTPTAAADSRALEPNQLAAALLSACAPFLGLALIVAAATFGIMTALLLLVAMAALAVIPALTSRPRLMLSVIVGMVVSNTAGVLGAHGVPRLELATLALGALTIARAVRRGELRMQWSPVYLAAGIFVAVQALSVLAADDRTVALTELRELTQAVALLVVVITLASDSRAIRAAVWAGVGVIAALAAVSILQQFVLHNSTTFFGFSNVPKVADIGGVTSRHSGPVEDANFWGRDLVLFLPLALVCAFTSAQWARRSWWAAAIAIAAGIYLTGSRGAMLSAAVSVVVLLAIGGPRYRRLLRLSPFVVAVALAVPGVGSRLLTLTELRQGVTDTTDPSIVGRISAMEQAVAMFRDRPLSGVGLGNFAVAQPEYQRRVGTLYGRVHAPHNLYLQLAAEGGIGAVASWLMLIATAMLLALRVALLRGPPRTRRDDSQGELLGAAIVAGLVGWSVAGAFLHLADLPMVLFVVGLGAAVALRASPRLESSLEGARVALGDPGRPDPAPGRAKRSVLVVAVFIGVVALIGLMLPLRHATTEAQAYAVVKPRPGTESAYVYDVANRRVVVRTYAAVVADPEFRNAVADELGNPHDSFSATVTTPLDSALVTVVVRSADADIARATAPVLLRRGSEYIKRLGSLFALEQLPSTTSSRTTRLDASHVAIALVVASLVAGALEIGLGGRRRTPAIDLQRRRTPAWKWSLR